MTLLDAHDNAFPGWVTVLRWSILALLLASWRHWVQALAVRQCLTPAIASQLFGWRRRAVIGVILIELVSGYPALLRFFG